MTQQLNRLPMWLTASLSALLLLLCWQLVIVLGDYDSFIFPSPAKVVRQFFILLSDGRWAKHTWITFSEVIPGLFIGLFFALPTGYLLAKSPLAERLISPYLIASQAVPVIAIAPLLAIWIESTYWSRVWVAVLVVFFPILVNVIAGIRAISPPMYEVMRSMRATKWQIFWKLEMPASLPILLAGLKVGATLSVIGTLVGEFVQPKSLGLAFLLITARFQFRTDLVFVVILTLAAMALSMYGIVTLLEKQFLPPQEK